MARDDERPDPDALLAEAATEGHGHLKVFLGAAPGVGKTWEMLEQARRRQAAGEDVVVGVVETHGRAETERQVGPLEILPRRAVPYKGHTLAEFDLDAALARRPKLLLVDELAHTNAPGSRHLKRWEDVVEIIRAGIDVWATLNVQHLESLNDDVARITGVRVAETLPDRVLAEADEIELIDLPPADLRQRLTEGKIYRPETATRALGGFFREGNLAALREIAMRRAAAHVDGDVRAWMRRTGVAGPWPAAERVLVLVGSDAGSIAVVRHAKRLAEALHAPWIALHIERAGTVENRAAMELAANLGAEIEIRGAADLVATTLEVALARNVTHVVIGRATATWWRRVTGRTLGGELLRRAGDYALHVVPLSVGQRPRKPRTRLRLARWELVGSLAGVALVTIAGRLLDGTVPAEAMGMVYLAVVVVSAGWWGMVPALLSATTGFLAWDFFFIPPLYAVSIGSSRDLIALAVFALVAAVVGGLAGRVRGEARAAQARIEGLRRIGAFSRKLGEATTEADLVREVARQAASIAGQAAVLAGEDMLTVRATEPAGIVLDEGALAAARWAWDSGEPAGRGTSTLPAAEWRLLPMRTLRGRRGVLALRAEELNPPQVQALEALADQAAGAWERVDFAAQGARATALEETQRLRTTLLASLGHDLRTPLAGIRGAADTLHASWAELAPEVRRDLLDSVIQQVARMTRYLADIADLTRLESGEIKPRLAPVRLLEAAEAALARVPENLHIGVNVPPEAVALADAALLEQVLVNLLENAVKFSPQGGRVWIRGGVESRGGMAWLAVADEGIGIAPEDIPRVFDTFYRADRTDRAVAGTGLGLAIARGLLDAMGGRIDAQSPRPDAPRDGSPGTIMTLRLPTPGLPAPGLSAS